MEKKQPRDTILYARIKKTNFAWINAEMSRLSFKSKSEYIDTLIDLAKEGKAAQEKKRNARKQK